MLKINWMEKKTSSTGNEYIRATITNEQGVEMKDVAIFSSFKGFAELAPGHDVEGTIETKDYNGKPSYSLKNAPSANGGGGFKRNPAVVTAAVKEAQERKEQSISKAQDRTEQIWAKRSAAEIVAHHPAFQNLGADEIMGKIHELASQIVNDEVDPF